MADLLTKKLLKMNERLVGAENTLSQIDKEIVGSGISFPANEFKYDVFWRSDLNTMFYYDAGLSMWLSTHLETLPFATIFERPNIDRLHLHTISPKENIVIVETDIAINKTSTHNATRRWVLRFNTIKNNVSQSLLNVDSFFDMTNVQGINIRRYRDVIPRLISGDSIITLLTDEFSNAGRIACTVNMRYRIVGV